MCSFSMHKAKLKISQLVHVHDLNCIALIFCELISKKRSFGMHVEADKDQNANAVRKVIKDGFQFRVDKMTNTSEVYSKIVYINHTVSS